MDTENWVVSGYDGPAVLIYDELADADVAPFIKVYGPGCEVFAQRICDALNTMDED